MTRTNRRALCAAWLACASALSAQTKSLPPACGKVERYDEFIVRVPPILLKNATACGKEGVEKWPVPLVLRLRLDAAGLTLAPKPVVSRDRGLVLVRPESASSPQEFQEQWSQGLPGAWKQSGADESEPNIGVVGASCAGTIPWGFDENKPGLAGTNARNFKLPQELPPVIVAIPDSGLGAGTLDLSGRIEGNWDILKGDEERRDESGHGTHIAGIIGSDGSTSKLAGVDPSARLLPIRFMDGRNEGTLAGAICAVEYATSLGARVVNQSWTLCGESIFLRTLMAGAENVLFVTAAGNSGINLDAQGGEQFPPSYRLPNQITVAAIDMQGKRTKSSNNGVSTVAIAAPGDCVKSLAAHGGTVHLSGTSMAAPFVSGAASLLFRTVQGLSAVRARCLLESTATKIDHLKADVCTGGILNVRAAVEAAEDSSVCPTPSATCQ